MSNRVKHVHRHSMHHDHYMSSLQCTSALALIHLHHTRSHEELLVAVQEEQTGTDPQEIQAGGARGRGARRRLARVRGSST